MDVPYKEAIMDLWEQINDNRPDTTNEHWLCGSGILAFAQKLLADPSLNPEAARYRWLRDEASNMHDVVAWHMPTATFLTGDALDILIDVHLKP